MKLNSTSALLYFKCMWWLTTGLYVLIPLKSGALSLIYYGVHGIYLLAMFLSLTDMLGSEQANQFEQRQILLLLAMLMTLFFSFATTEEPITFSVQITGALGFLEMLFAIYLIDKVPKSADTEAFVFKANLVIAMVFIVLSHTSYAYSGNNKGSMNLGYANPNATAIYLLMNAALLFLYAEKVRKKAARVLVYAICAYLFYLIYKTDSRSCLVAAGVVVLWSVFAPRKRLPRGLIPVFLLIPLGFLFAYVAMHESGQYAELTILGKPFFSGREGIFVEKLSAFKAYWLVGDVGKNPFNNMHNGALTLLCSCGVLGYIIYLRYTGATLRHYYKGDVTKEQNVALIVIFSIFAHSCSEAALIAGGANYSIVVATFYWLLKEEAADGEQQTVFRKAARTSTRYARLTK